MNNFNNAKNFLLCFLIAGLFSCNPNSDKELSQENHSTINLSGQVYIYAPELDTTTCEAFGQCDCCSGNFLFLNDRDFIVINVCEADNDYCKGTYEIKEGNLILHYDSLSIEQNYNWEKESDTTGTVTEEYFIKCSKIKTATITLTRIDCNKNICFKTTGEQITFITLDKKTKQSDIIKNLKDQGIWEKLKLSK